MIVDSMIPRDVNELFYNVSLNIAFYGLAECIADLGAQTRFIAKAAKPRAPYTKPAIINLGREAEHHGIAKVLGGADEQYLYLVFGKYHREFHSLLNRNIRAKGLPPVMGRGYTSRFWARYLAENSGAQTKAFEAIIETSIEIDARYNTNFLDYFMTNMLSGNFTMYP